MAELDDGVWVRFKGDISDLSDKMDDVVKETAAASAKATTSFGDFFGALESGFSSIPGMVEGLSAAISASIAVPLAGFEAAALAAATAFDEAFDNIRAKTGAVGEELKGLQETFKTVFADVPDSAGKVSQALSFLSARTHETGVDLDALTKSFLDLSRLTGESLQPLMQSTTRLFGEWHVAVDQQVTTMDKLLVVAQKTGVGVTAIAESLTKFGPALQEFGISLDKGAAMFASFEASGRNAEKMMGGLRTALTNFAKAGEDPAAGLDRMVQAIRNADENTGLLIARQVVGKQSAADWAQAIRDGSLDVSKLVESLDSASGAIADGIKDTEDFAEAWAKFKNQIMIAIEPLGSVLFQALNSATEAMKPVINVIQALGKAFDEMDPASKKLAAAFPLVTAGVVALSSAIGVGLLPVTLTVAAAFGAWKLGEWALSFKPVRDAVDSVVQSIKDLINWAAKIPVLGAPIKLMGDSWKFLADAAHGAGEEMDKSFNLATGEYIPAAEAAVRNVGTALKGTASDADFFGLKAKKAAADAAAELLKFQQGVVNAENAVTRLLISMPQTFEEFDRLGAKGDGMSRSLTKMADDLIFKYGEKMPAAIRNSVESLLAMNTQIAKWQTEAGNLKLDVIFDKINLSLRNLALNVKETYKENKDEIDMLMASSMAAFNASAERIKELDAASRTLGVTLTSAYLANSQAADRALAILIKYGQTANDINAGEAKAIQQRILLYQNEGKSTEALEAQLQAVNLKLQESARSAMTLDQALKTVGVGSLDDLRKKALDSAAAFEKIYEAAEKGKASAVQAAQAHIAMLNDQIRLGKEAGQSVDSINAALIIETENLRIAQGALTGWGTAFATFGVNVNKILQVDMANSLTGAIMHLQGFGKAFEDLGKKILEMFINTALKELFKSLNVFDLQMASSTSAIGKFASSLGTLFGGGSSAINAAGGMGATGAELGATGSTISGGAGSAVSGAIGGITGIVGAVGSVVSAVSGVISNFQMHNLTQDTGKIEVNTRSCLNQLIALQNTANKWWPYAENTVQLLRLEGIENGINKLVEGGGGVRVATELGRVIVPPMEMIGEDVRGLGVALSIALNGFMLDFTDPLLNAITDMSREIRSFREQAIPFLQSISQSTIALYNTANKPGNGVNYLVPASQTRTSSNTFNINVPANTPDAYRQGQMIVQGINSQLAARI